MLKLSWQKYPDIDIIIILRKWPIPQYIYITYTYMYRMFSYFSKIYLKICPIKFYPVGWSTSFIKVMAVAKKRKDCGIWCFFHTLTISVSAWNSTFSKLLLWLVSNVKWTIFLFKRDDLILHLLIYWYLDKFTYI